MSRVADRLVVDVVDLPQKGVAHRAEPARRREGFELDAVDEEGLDPFHGRDPLFLALLDHLAVVEILVDDAFGRPVEGVSEESGRMARQGADPHPDGSAMVELLCEVGADDADEPRREAALRRHEATGGGAHRDDGFRGGHVLGQVEVMHASRMRDFGDRGVEVVGQAGQDGFEGLQ